MVQFITTQVLIQDNEFLPQCIVFGKFQDTRRNTVPPQVFHGLETVVSCEEFIGVPLASDDDRMEKPCRLDRRLEHVKMFPIRSYSSRHLNVGNLDTFNR